MDVVNLADFEALARELLPEASYDYFAGGAADEITLADNRAAFDRLRIVPRVLRPGERTARTSVLGADVDFPVLVAPVAYQQVAHRDGELAIARGAAAAGTAMCLSSLSNNSLEDVAAVAPAAPRFFQLYPYRDRGMTEDVVQRAQAAGYRALFVTVDVPVHGRREREQRRSFALPADAALPCVPVPAHHSGPVTPTHITSWMRPDLGWDDVEHFVALTDMPVVLKGVLSAEDAVLAADAGAAGIVVSNHGGRQLDTAIATIDVLAEIADAVGDRIEVLLDGGVRRGTDVLKALALGARAVLIGRPIVWSLTVAGAAGVQHCLELIGAETAQALALAGCRAPDDARPELVRRRPS
jgi:4-hydroxymandelate oxidase